ncbi:MAG: peptidylprolyl isomerase [Magnetococcales bacterium]|nr:peptidylprolyl isomerase [Magnetococcales bacterium]
MRLTGLTRLLGLWLIAWLMAGFAAAPAHAADPTPPSSPPSQEKKMVRLTTNLGEITVELFADKAPKSVANFLQYVESGFFNNTIFHRVIPGFMVQCGGMTADMGRKETRAPIKNEADNGLKNQRGTLAMARTAAVDSATSQFFINLNDNAFLDNGARDFGYAVFGKVSAGMDVVDKIAAVKTGSKAGHQDVPLETVTILKAERIVTP